MRVHSCDSAIKLGDYQSALNICETQLKDAQKENNPADEINLFLHLFDVYHELGYGDRVDDYLIKIKGHPLYLSDIRLQYLWNRKAGQKQYALSDYEQAKIYLYQGLAIAKEQNDPLWLSKSYNDIGLVEYKLNHHKESLKSYKQSLELKIKYGNKYQVGKTLNNLGLIHLQREEYDTAINYYEQALSHYLDYTHEESFDKRVFYKISHIYEDLTNAYISANKLDKANYYAQEILNTFNLKLSAREQSRALINIAKWHIKKSEYQPAKTFLEQALNLQNLDEFDNRAEIFEQLSLVYEHSEDLASAIRFATWGLEQSKKSKDSPQTTAFYKRLSHLYRSIDKDIALNFLELYQKNRETFLNNKYNAEVKTIQHQIEKQQIERDLTAEQLENISNKSKIQSLNNWSLLVVILLLSSVSFTVFFLSKKKKEREVLLQSIGYHKQQLFLLDSKHQDIEKTFSPKLNNSDIKQLFKKHLVQAMIEALSIWEKHTRSNKIELAEKSKIWTISIDNGTLRTRSLDKYLAVDKIPDNPKWRNVVRTCHFVLSDSSLNASDRITMAEKLESVMTVMKELSLNSHHLETTEQQRQPLHI